MRSGKDLECETRFACLPHDRVHSRWITLQIDFARHLKNLAAEKPLPLLRSPRPVVHATRVEVDVPALLFYECNHLRFVRADAHHYTQVANPLAPVPDGFHFPFAECNIHNFALTVKR